MQFTGKIVGLSNNLITGSYDLTIAVHSKKAFQSGYDEVKDEEELDIQVRKQRKKRSLNANAYFHVLVDKLADKLNISKPRCKNIMIGRYGQPFYVDDSETAEAVIKTNIPVDRMLENETVHCFPCGHKEENGSELVFYKVFRGSSTYDTREMSILINGTVIECKEQGIETIPPDELERMLSAWKPSGGLKEENPDGSHEDKA